MIRAIKPAASEAAHKQAEQRLLETFRKLTLDRKADAIIVVGAILQAQVNTLKQERSFKVIKGGMEGAKGND